MDATIRVHRAKVANRSINSNMPNMHYHSLPKQISGHPYPNPLVGHEVNLNQEYQVGDNPPLGLLPLHYCQIEDTAAHDVLASRARLMAIHWFYNEPMLFITPNANASRCIQGWRTIRAYLKN
ncbi:Unknown protein [Striga hermonthica]|uniref:Uncharacterized protein n=1 Tax=Striga hermonthica TaxID=68872 RepID=A0A9N7NY88_STRHE|nr:Unknown protein [Striga hermonthica]